MTQMSTDAITLYSVQGKDRLSDSWVTFESRWRWEVQAWADQRSFVVRDEEGEPLVTTRQPGQAYIERKDSVLGWVAYTAPGPYIQKLTWLERHEQDHPATKGFYRLVEVPAAS
jgi:hypothetical protein